MHVRAASEQSPCLCAAFGCKWLQARERPCNRLSNDSGAQREQRAPEPSDSRLGGLAGLAVAGVRTCLDLPAVLTTPANRASPSEVPAAPPAVTSTRSQSQR